MSIRARTPPPGSLAPVSKRAFPFRVRASQVLGIQPGSLTERARHGLAAALNGLSRVLSTPLDDAELVAKTLVFAPHPDDETLGCGGTLLLKRARGAEVGVAFLTDGSKSHPALVPAETLANQRRLEALEACQRLGISEGSVTWMGFPDGELSAHEDAATARVVELLTAWRPHLVFAPYPVSEHPDHVTTERVVREALRRAALDGPVTLLEYPIWFWHHFPWVSLRGSEGHALLAKTIAAGFGLRALTDLDARVDVRAVRQAKRAALAAHRSQLERRDGDPGWWTLGDVSDGEFLEHLLGDEERFRRIRVRG